MSGTVRIFVMGDGGWTAKRVPKGHRKPEWNNEMKRLLEKSVQDSVIMNL